MMLIPKLQQARVLSLSLCVSIFRDGMNNCAGRLRERTIRLPFKLGVQDYAIVEHVGDTKASLVFVWQVAQVSVSR
jgi:hypothetical protein